MMVARVLMRGARRWTDAGHPWIYRSDVEAVPGDTPGVVAVEDARGAPIGMALWSPTSAIALRMLTTDVRPIDGAFWAERIEAAQRYRERLAPDATAYRLVHGEADGLPSLVVDRYGEALVVQLLSAGLEAHRADVIGALSDVLAPTGILARNDVPVRRHEQLPRTTELLAGAVAEEIAVREGAIRYLAAPWTGQKTGAFLDQRENRGRAAAFARGRALDCFSYHGSFALHLASAATDVTAVDSSAEALERAAANAALNRFGHVSTVQASVFDFLRAQESAGASYDVIVVDPPAFAKTRSSLAGALRGYKEVNLRALRILAPGGTLLTFSCSYHVDRERFRAMLESAAADAHRPVRWIEARSQALDHPELLQIPESSYLKGAVLQAMD
jgi:23S rRNA (cytosine1962-C5)-methyltransferase